MVAAAEKIKKIVQDAKANVFPQILKSLLPTISLQKQSAR